jgi:hypothetical protein
LEILSHDIKAGAGINAIAAIRGYAEATPIIGYREKTGAEGEDKKGEFFIRGDMEIAAQPFLGLSGDLFVEVDAPWWSPVPDKKWTWPLGDKEWPIGGTFGIGASVDYVFGSGQVPAVEFKSVDFSAEKFFTDLYNDKAKAKGEAAAEKAGEWKERNSREAEPPKGEMKGDAKAGKPPPLPAAKPKVEPGGPKKATKPAPDSARTAEGKTVKEYKDEAAAKKGKPAPKEPKKGTAKEAKTPTAGDKEAKQKASVDVSAAKKTVKDALATQLPKGARQVAEVNKVLSGVASRAKPALTNFRAEEVMPGRPKEEGVIGFKVKASAKDGTTVLIGSVRYSKSGTALSLEERWQAGVKGIKRAIKQLEKRGTSDKVIKAQFPRWQSEFGFSALTLNTEQTPWVLEGEMSPGKKITEVTGPSMDEVGKALRTRGRKLVWDAITANAPQVYLSFVEEITEKAALAAIHDRQFMEWWEEANSEEAESTGTWAKLGSRFHAIARRVGEKIYRRRWPYPNITVEFELEVAGGKSRIDVLILESTTKMYEYDYKTRAISALGKNNRDEMDQHLDDLRTEFNQEALDVMQHAIPWRPVVERTLETVS